MKAKPKPARSVGTIDVDQRDFADPLRRMLMRDSIGAGVLWRLIFGILRKSPSSGA
jgi:hypothetical protein